jgi:hypothetical protein
MKTFSDVEIKFATVANVLAAGMAFSLQLSLLYGQSIKQPEWGSNSAGMIKASFLGFVFRCIFITFLIVK